MPARRRELKPDTRLALSQAQAMELPPRLRQPRTQRQTECPHQSLPEAQLQPSHRTIHRSRRRKRSGPQLPRLSFHSPEARDRGRLSKLPSPFRPSRRLLLFLLGLTLAGCFIRIWSLTRLHRLRAVRLLKSFGNLRPRRLKLVHGPEATSPAARPATSPFQTFASPSVCCIAEDSFSLIRVLL